MPDTSATKPRVLVVDGERVIADTVAMILNQSGFQARSVYSGEKAVEFAAAFKPDLLYSQVFLCNMSGIDAAIRIRRMMPSIKVRLISGQAKAADLLEQAHAQGHDFEIWACPVHPQDLLSWLRAEIGLPVAPAPPKPPRCPEPPLNSEPASNPEPISRVEPPSFSRRVADAFRTLFEK